MDSTDGSAPIYVAFTEGRGIEGGILYSAQGPRLLTLSVGSLAAVEDDSQLAMLIGHELKHPPSQIQELLDQKKQKGFVSRSGILDRIKGEALDTGLKKTIENEADVRSLLDKVHPKGYSPAQAVRIYDILERQYGDVYKFSHPLILQRTSILQGAMTKLTRGDGEVLRQEPVHEVTDARWKAYFSGPEYRKSGSKKIQEMLRPRPIPEVEEVLRELKAGGTTDLPPGSGKFILSSEVGARWRKLSPMILDRSLRERVRIAEALSVRVIKDFLEAKNRILGEGFVPRSLAEAAYLLELWSFDPRNQVARGSLGSTTEERIWRLSGEIGDAEKKLAQAKTSQSLARYQASAQMEAAESELRSNRSLKDAIAQLYSLPRAELEHEIHRIETANANWNKAEQRQLEARLRVNKKALGPISKSIEVDQKNALRHFTEKVEASLGKDDAVFNHLREFSYELSWMPQTDEAYRKWWLRDLPAHLARRLALAIPGEREKIGLFLDRIWREQLPALATQTQINQAFSTPDSVSELKVLVQAMNEYRQGSGENGFVFASGEGQENLLFDDRSSRIIYPKAQSAQFEAGELPIFEQRKASLMGRIRSERSAIGIGDLLDDFISEQKDALSKESTPKWLSGVRDEMANRYRVLIPGIQAPGEVAEAVLDLKLRDFHGQSYGLGSKEVFKRLREAQTTEPLAAWEDLFSYTLRSPSASQYEVFETIRGSGRALKHDARTQYVHQSDYWNQMRIRRNFADWAAENDPKNVKEAISALGNVYGERGAGLKSLNAGQADLAKQAGQVAQLYRENGKVNWKRYFETGLIDPYYTGPDEFWEELSKGDHAQWLRDALSFDESLDVPQLSQRFKASPSFISGLRKLPLNQAFLRNGPAASATPEELQKLLLSAFSSQSKPFPERDELFQLFWKATAAREELRAPFSDERWVSRLMFTENRLSLSRHQLSSRFTDIRKGLGARNSSLATNQIEAIKRSILRQFPDPSFTRNELLDWVEKKLVTTPREHRALAPLWVNQENWVQMKGLSLSDTLEAVSKALSDNGERLDFVRFLTGRTKHLPQNLERALENQIGEASRIQAMKKLLPLLPSRFQALDRYERAAALHPFLAGKSGVLARPETLSEARRLVLGKFAQDDRFNAFFDAYFKHAPEHEQSILTSFLLGQTGDGERTAGQVLRDILEAMPPIGPRTGQEIRSSGWASETINQELNQLLDRALPPTQDQIHSDIERIFGPNANRVRVGKLRGSGSVNYIVDIEIYDPNLKIWIPRVLKVQREKVAEHVRAEAKIWRGGLAELKQHPDAEVRSLAQIAEESMEQAVSKLEPGKVELDARKEADLYDSASKVYNSAQTRAVRPDESAMRLIAQSEQVRAGIYERIEGDALSTIQAPTERARFAKAVLDQELGAIFQKGAFDTDPQLGNWLRERSSGSYVRLDYAQFASVDRKEVESFRKVIGVLMDPKLKSAGAWIEDWASIMTPSVPQKVLRREVDAILRGAKMSSARGLFERFTILRQELNERLSKGGHPAQTLRDSSRRVWTSLKKLSGIRGEYLADREFFEVLNQHIRMPMSAQWRLGKASGMTTSELIGSALDECQVRFKGVFRFR